MTLVMIPSTVGELLDRISIMQIKAERFTDRVKRQRARDELAALQAVRPGIEKVWPSQFAELCGCNAILWDLENGLRYTAIQKPAWYRKPWHIAELAGVALKIARQQARRAELKAWFCARIGSALTEDKEYAA